MILSTLVSRPSSPLRHMPNFTSTSCNPNWLSPWENVKYAAQMVYLLPVALLYIRILYVILKKHRKVYCKHQFFVIYSMDAVVGLLLLLLDIFITRLFIYTPQFCLSASAFFLSNPFLMHIYYPLLNYLHCSRAFIQIFLTTNRMSSVLFPLDHNKIWASKMSLIILFVTLAPFLFIWNAIISRKYLIYYFGGFIINYSKAVSWARMSTVLMMIRSVTVGVTVVSTVVTFWRMTKMKKRLRRSERMMCVASALISLCFMFPAGFEALTVFSTAWYNSNLGFLFQPFAWDVLNVGSPLVMIFVSSQLRAHVFSKDSGAVLFSGSNRLSD